MSDPTEPRAEPQCSDGDPAEGTFWERSVIERFVRGGRVHEHTIRSQVGVLLADHDRLRTTATAAPPTEAAARADERAKVAEDIAAAYARGYGRGRDDEADGMPVQPVETVAAGRTPTPESPGKHDAAETPSGAKPCGCVGECPSLFKPCPVCGAEVRAVAVDNSLATTYRPCGHVVPDGADDHDDRQEQ